MFRLYTDRYPRLARLVLMSISKCLQCRYEQGTVGTEGEPATAQGEKNCLGKGFQRSR